MSKIIKKKHPPKTIAQEYVSRRIAQVDDMIRGIDVFIISSLGFMLFLIFTFATHLMMEIWS